MDTTRQQAQEVIAEIDEVSEVVRKRASYALGGPILIIWGIVWIVCFTVTHYRPAIAGWVWMVGDTLGIAGTAYFGWFHPRTKAVRSDADKRLSRRKVFWFWLLLFIYADIWLAILWPWQGVQLNAFGVTLVMFAFIVMGLLTEMRPLVWLGAAVTVLACVGYAHHLIGPRYLNLWLDLVGGGAMLGTGVYLLRYWGPAHA